MVDLFARHHVSAPQPTQANLPLESLELVSVLIKISQMNIFVDLLPEEIFKCQFFWQTLILCTAKQMANELKLVFESAEASIKSVGGAVITYKQIHEILKKASNSKSMPFQPQILPQFNMMGVLPNF